MSRGSVRVHNSNNLGRRSAADDISGEVVAIKLVTRVAERIQLAKRALREITILRHFSQHENITGLIDVDAMGPDLKEMYVRLLCEIRAGLIAMQLYIYGGKFENPCLCFLTERL